MDLHRKTSQSHPVLLKKEMMLDFFSQSLKFHKRKEVMLDCSSLKSLLQSVDFSTLGTSQRSSPQNCTLAMGAHSHFVKALKGRKCSTI